MQNKPLCESEIKPMLKIYEDETNKIIGKAGNRQVKHPKNLELL